MRADRIINQNPREGVTFPIGSMLISIEAIGKEAVKAADRANSLTGQSEEACRLSSGGEEGKGELESWRVA